MSRIKTYDTYTEIPNGLFVDIENEKANIQFIDHESGNMIRDEAEGMTMEQFEAASPITNNVTRERNLNEGIWHQLRNMSEQETIQYFDRISQEEE